MTTTDPLVFQMHDAYCVSANFRITLTLDRQRDLEILIGRGVTLEDFKLVMRSLNLKIAKGERNPGAMRWSNLVADAARFEEELGMAKAENRNTPPPTTVKTKWLPRPSLDTARHISACLPTPERLAELARKAHEACEGKGV